MTFNAEAAENQAINLVVTDLSGREVLRATGTQHLEFTKDLSALPKGMYITTFEVAGRASTQKPVS